MSKIKKYIIPISNCLISSFLALGLNFRDDSIIAGIFFTMIILGATIYQIVLIRKNGNEIKIHAINKMMTLLSATLLAGFLYEAISGQMISDEIGDYMAIIFLIIGAVILLYDYYIKPLKRK